MHPQPVSRDVMLRQADGVCGKLSGPSFSHHIPNMTDAL